jgi:hypothetical protein
MASVAGGPPGTARAIRGEWSTPNPDVACLVERGAAYLVDVNAPTKWTTVETHGPVTLVKEATRADALLLCSDWAVTAVGAAGVLWSTRRLSIERLRIDSVGDAFALGVADPDDDAAVGFSIDLRTGIVTGGFPPEGGGVDT